VQSVQEILELLMNIYRRIFDRR